jgi:hypothetical protein
MRMWLAMAATAAAAAAAIYTAAQIRKPAAPGTCLSPCTVIITEAGGAFQFPAATKTFVARAGAMVWQVANQTQHQQIVVEMRNFRKYGTTAAGNAVGATAAPADCPGGIDQGEALPVCGGRTRPVLSQSQIIKMNMGNAAPGDRFAFDIAAGADANDVTPITQDPDLEIERNAFAQRLILAGSSLALIAAAAWAILEVRRRQRARRTR